VSEVIVMRPFLPLLVCALVASAAGTTANAAGKKLYRWTDEKGEVHYTDALPPEAAKAANDRLNEKGMAVEKRLAEERAKMDAILLNSYPTEADLARAYEERFDLLERTLESAQVGITSQERSLDELLNHAAGLERAGKPVPDKVAQSIAMARRQVAEQREVLVKRQAEKAALQAEYDQVLGRYRELAAPAASTAASQEG
jgi:hypothetical protein